MKKLMVAVCAMGLASVVNAASVSWGGAVTSADGDGTLVNGTIAALVWSSTDWTGDITSIDKMEKGGIAKVGDTKAATVVHTATLGEDEAYFDMFEAEYKKTGSVDGYYAVLVKDENSDMASYYKLAAVSGTDDTSPLTPRVVNSTQSGDEYLTKGGYTVAIGDVPEPTSGLLLLLGVAGLALKRRRA